MTRVDDLKWLIEQLEIERAGKPMSVREESGEGATEQQLFKRFRALVNKRKPAPASDEFLEVQDRVLRSMIADAGLTNASELPRTSHDCRISLWRGDITTLQIDAVVNAANSELLGCWTPGHHCIDNAIHTFAGIQLRCECARIMQEQGYLEPKGSAKVTSSYNLPCEYIIHTVAPITQRQPTDKDRELLASCYQNCLDAALKVGCKSIAFCCIGTGVYGFPRDEAAQIAVETVRSWLDAHTVNIHVVFNVFSEEDEQLYQKPLLA